jgi:ribosomal protein S18 acetylase RimI-like enzyme
MSDDRSAADTMVRECVWSDANAVGATLARAFDDDPLVGHFLPDGTTRPPKAARMFRLLLKLGLPHHACYMTSGAEAVALWRPPGKWHLSVWDYIANGPGMLSIFGFGTMRVMSAMDLIEKKHPHEPHYYLQTLGTDPSKQGKGFAGKVVRHQTTVADREGVACYLESSKSTNIPVYQALGFRVTGEIVLPNGPTIWPMWRDPKR